MRVAAGVVAVCVATGVPSGAGAQPPKCDRALLQRAQQRAGGSSNIYQPLGDRCEGIYDQKVSGSGEIALIGFTAAFEPYDTAKYDDLVVAWDAVAGDSLRIVASEARPLLSYRMDATRTFPESPFRWPTTILREEGIEHEEIAVRAWTTMRVGGRVDTVYVPLRIGPRRAPEPTGSYELVIAPLVGGLYDLEVTVAPLGPDGREQAPVLAKRLGGETLVPHYGVRVPLRLPDRHAPGLYRVHVTAAQPGDNPARLWAVVVIPR
jgi:hypothetical protein